MKLNILVTHFDEPAEIVARLLDSIAIQQGVNLSDVSVIIYSDGTALNPHLFRRYPFNVQYRTKKHGGISSTRNAGLDAAVAEYVMFCDCDDMFGTVYGLYTIFKEIDKNRPDVLISKFIEEVQDEAGNIAFADHDMDGTFIHGKVFKTDYLKKNNIRFNDALMIHEDSYFVTLSTHLTDNVHYTDKAFYLYKYNADSIVRRSRKTFLQKTFTDMIKANDALVDELDRRGLHKEAAAYSAYMFIECFLCLNYMEWKGRDKRRAEIRTAGYMLKNIKRWNDSPEDIKEEAKREVNKDVPHLSLPGLDVIDTWVKTVIKGMNDYGRLSDKSGT